MVTTPLEASLWLLALCPSLTLCSFELLLQRCQLQSEELGHLLVLLLLPAFNTKPVTLNLI